VRGGTVPRALVALLAIVLSLAAIKAGSADLTWDEAWTYLHYGRSAFGFLALDYANDHPLNSLLVWASARLFGASELAIRLPNLLAAALYLYASAILVRGARLPALAFGLCVLQPYLFDYFALARGYGIAAALVQYGLVAHFFAPGERGRYATMLAACLAASLSVFSTVVALYALIAATMLHPPRRTAPALVFGLLGLVPVAGLAFVSREGLPLYGGTGSFFDAVPRSLARMYMADGWAGAGALLALLGLAALLLLGASRFGRRTRTLLLAAGLTLGASWAAARILGKPLPTGRVLIPFVPLLNLAVIAAAEDVHATSRHPGRITAAAGAVCAILAAVWLGRLHFERYRDWPEDAHLAARTARALATGRPCLPPELWDRYGSRYYLARWFAPGPVPDPPRCPSP
jgi:hypothetical protein